ncbi:hypothetical protein AGMMS49593_02180 [Endomicrobiia bacterium]|nr:hypothetical protein AGMMS49593_02180 [Endomicrobiia bacterium]
MTQAGIDTLKHYIANGIKLIGAYENNALIAGGDTDKYKEAFTSCLTDIKALCQGKGDSQGRAKGTVVNVFRFIPKDSGYLIIDIDRNHADGIDGLEMFYAFFERLGKTRDAMPQAMQNIEGGSFPCFVSTPSGGFHLYFKFNKDVRTKQTIDAKGIDILYTKQATAAGSVKSKGEYTLHGKLTDAPMLYGFLKKHILQPSPQVNPNLKYEYTNGNNKKFADNAVWNKKVKNEYSSNKIHQHKYTWDEIVKYTDKDGYGRGGRNNRAYSLAYKAATHGWDLHDTICELVSEPDINGLSLKEIENTVKSAYKKAGRI